MRRRWWVLVPAALCVACAAFLQPPFLITAWVTHGFWLAAAGSLVVWWWSPRWREVAVCMFVVSCASRAASQAFIASAFPWQSRIVAVTVFATVGVLAVRLAADEE